MTKNLNINIHGWVWAFNRPNDTLAMQNLNWYSVNKKGESSYDARPYVDYYQWLSPFSSGATNHIKNNIKKAIRTNTEELPIAMDSIDVLLLPHVLEYSKDTHKLLREIERVLICEGHAVIIGINPLSLWGLWQLFFCWWNKISKVNSFYSKLVFFHCWNSSKNC